MATAQADVNLVQVVEQTYTGTFGAPNDFAVLVDLASDRYARVTAVYNHDHNTNPGGVDCYVETFFAGTLGTTSVILSGDSGVDPSVSSGGCGVCSRDGAVVIINRGGSSRTFDIRVKIEVYSI